MTLYTRKVTPAMIESMHQLLSEDASTEDIHALASLVGLSYSTCWHIVRGYCRHVDARWRTAVVIPMEGVSLEPGIAERNEE